uniref:Dual specificity tyrosine phosphorylation regulated kinase 3 n=2 Tax=Rhinopithecus TaxID=542827 RepID=A0A2K6KLL3_RHIBE
MKWKEKLGDGVYDTFMMIDETKCPPCSNVLCNPSEPPPPRRLNILRDVTCLAQGNPAGGQPWLQLICL